MSNLLERITKLQRQKFEQTQKKRVIIDKSRSHEVGGFAWFFEEMDRLGLWDSMDDEWKDRRLEE